MSARDSVSFPLIFLSFSAENWIPLLQDFWSIVLPAGGAVLLTLQIIYYWNKNFGNK